MTPQKETNTKQTSPNQFKFSISEKGVEFDGDIDEPTRQLLHEAINNVAFNKLKDVKHQTELLEQKSRVDSITVVFAAFCLTLVMYTSAQIASIANNLIKSGSQSTSSSQVQYTITK